MKTADERALDAISLRAIHDQDMRDVLESMGLTQADPRALRSALAALSPQDRDALLRRCRDMEDETGRSNRAYSEVIDSAHRRWVELIGDGYHEASKAMAEFEPTLKAIPHRRHLDHQPLLARLKDLAARLVDVVLHARAQLGRSIRQNLPRLGLRVDADARAAIVDYLVRAFPVPLSISQAIVAPDRLQAALGLTDPAPTTKAKASTSADPAPEPPGPSKPRSAPNPQVGPSGP